MKIYQVKPYRGAWFKHLLRLEFRTAFCALFGLARWHIPVQPSRLIDNLGLTITEEMLAMARDAAKVVGEQGLVAPRATDAEKEAAFISGVGTGPVLGVVDASSDWCRCKAK